MVHERPGNRLKKQQIKKILFGGLGRVKAKLITGGHYFFNLLKLLGFRPENRLKKHFRAGKTRFVSTLKFNRMRQQQYLFNQ